MNYLLGQGDDLWEEVDLEFEDVALADARSSGVDQEDSARYAQLTLLNLTT